MAALTSTSTGWTMAGLPCCASGLAMPSALGSPSPTRWCWPLSSREDRSAGRCCARASTRTEITFFTYYDSAKGDDFRRDAVCIGDLPVVFAEQAVPYPRSGHQGRPAGQPGLLVEPAARLAAGRVGVTSVSADRIACGAGRSARRGDGPLRRHRADPRSAELGRVPHRARRRSSSCAGTRRPAAQPNSCGRWTHRTPAALAR